MDLSDLRDLGTCGSNVENPSIWLAPPSSPATDEAKAVCSVCPVRVPCLELGLHEPVGVWGGLDETERTGLALTLGRPKPKPVRVVENPKIVEALARERRERERAAAPGRCPKCRSELSFGISKCGSCTRSPKAGPNSLPY